MDLTTGSEPTTAVSFDRDPKYLALSRMLARYQNLILLTPTTDEKLEARVAQWQKKAQAELWSPLPYHRMKWLRSIEGARTLLLKLEQTAQGIKVQRTKREAIKDLAEKRMIIRRLRARVEEIGREVESGSNTYRPKYQEDDDETETMYDVLQQIRRSKDSAEEQREERVVEDKLDQSADEPKSIERTDEDARIDLFESKSTVRRRQGQAADENYTSRGKTAGFADPQGTEDALLASSREHEDITTSLVSMAAQLKQQARQFQFTLDQDKGLLDRALEGLDQNVSAMGLASKGVKTLQRMSEEQGFFGRLKLQLFIAGMWAVAILLVFAGPKLRF